MSTGLDSNNWIFVNYAPGSFGSFLTKVIELSPSVSGSKGLDVFNEYNASHLNVSRWISKFHDGDDLELWAQKTVEQQHDYLINNIQSVPTTLKQVHRLTIPKYNSKFGQHFPNAKFIKITVEPTYINLVAQNMARKTIDNWLTKLADPLKTILSQVSKQQQIEYYLKECRQRITNIVDNTEQPETFNFPVQLFFDTAEFNKIVAQLIEWLGIEAVDHRALHEEFLTRHKEFINQ